MELFDTWKCADCERHAGSAGTASHQPQTQPRVPSLVLCDT